MHLFLEKFFPEVFAKMKRDDAKVSNYCRFNSQLLTSFTSSLYIAGLVASFFASWITKSYGRMPSIRTGGDIFLPETPSSVIQRTNNREKARKVLEKIRGTSEIESELTDLTLASEISNSISIQGNPFRTIIKIKYRPQLVMAIAIPFFQQVTGINVIAFSAPLLFRTIGMGESASLMSAVLTGAIGILTTFLSMLIVDRIRRRKLFLIGGIQMLVSQMLVGGIMAAELGDRGGIGRKYAVVVIVLISNYVAGFGLSWGLLGWLVPSEIFAMEIRSAGQSIVVAVSFLFTFVVAQSFLEMLCRFFSALGMGLVWLRMIGWVKK